MSQNYNTFLKSVRIGTGGCPFHRLLISSLLSDVICLNLLKNNKALLLSIIIIVIIIIEQIFQDK